MGIRVTIVTLRKDHVVTNGNITNKDQGPPRHLTMMTQTYPQNVVLDVVLSKNDLVIRLLPPENLHLAMRTVTYPQNVLFDVLLSKNDLSLKVAKIVKLLKSIQIRRQLKKVLRLSIWLIKNLLLKTKKTWSYSNFFKHLLR